MLLDNQYKVLSEKSLSSHLTFFEALDPESKAVYVLWYNLYSPEEENAFEDYRKLLRSLKKQGLAAIQSLVARPGAYYVAWHKPSADSKRLRNGKSAIESIEKILTSNEREISEAQVYLDADGKSRIYMLPFCPPAEVNNVDAKAESPDQAPQLTITTIIEHHTRHKASNPLIKFWKVVRVYLPAAFMLSLAIPLLWLSLKDYVSTPALKVPTVVGKPVEEVAQELSKLGFKVSMKAVPSNEVAGKVLEVVPPENSWLRKGQEVTLQYGFPKSQLPLKQVPNLEGFKDLEVVRNLLTEAGLELGKVLYVFTNLEKNTVIAQSHLVGENLPEGRPVDIIMSNGPRGTYSYMPDLRGLPLEEARSFARLVGFNYPIEIEWRPNANLSSGTVITQNIAPENLVNLQSAVLRLVVAGKGTVSKTTPNFIGMSLSQAENLAKERGLVINISEISTFNLLEGVVIQDPAPHQALQNPVTLTVNVHPEISKEPVAIEREVTYSYSWFIEFGIPQQLAEVTAETPEGRIVVENRYVEGGEELAGSWKTTNKGEVTFYLTLNDINYSIPLVVMPEVYGGGLEPP